MPPDRLKPFKSYLAFAVSKGAAHNSRQSWWEAARLKVVNAFARHDLSMKWSFAEFDASRNLAWSSNRSSIRWRRITSYPGAAQGVCGPGEQVARNGKAAITSGPSAIARWPESDSILHICVDPPYYDNVMYAECSNFFYIWMKRTLGKTYPELFASELTNEEDEAVMNVARFKDHGAQIEDTGHGRLREQDDGLFPGDGREFCSWGRANSHVHP